MKFGLSVFGVLHHHQHHQRRMLDRQHHMVCLATVLEVSNEMAATKGEQNKQIQHLHRLQIGLDPELHVAHFRGRGHRHRHRHHHR